MKNPQPHRLAFAIHNVLLAACMASLAGCASPMALDARKTLVPGEGKPIGIFTLKTENKVKPGYQPEVASLHIVSDAKKTTTFKPSRPYRQGDRQPYEYLISVELDPGNYALQRVQGLAGDGFFIQGNFDFPVNSTFTLAPASVVYLGHVEMINRNRNEGEDRAGSLFPLIDQAVCGFSSGTFDITVSDQSEADIASFTAAYPALNGINIGKAVMSPPARGAKP